MKSAFVIAAVVAFVGSAQAQCECDAADSECLNECVVTTRDCISECQNNECYNRCITYHWPGVDPKTQSIVSEQPTPTWQMGSSSTSSGPTSTAWISFPAPTTVQSSQWIHTNEWAQPATARASSGPLPSASASASPSTSGSLSTLQMSRAILGVTLAAVVAYTLQ